MANVFDYVAPKKVTIKNVINPEDCKYKACDAGSPVTKVEMAVADIKDKPCVKFDYIVKEDGTIDAEKVLVHVKTKNTDRQIPAYRTFNGKVLKAGDSMEFVTNNKDEMVFFEKVADLYKGEVTVEFAEA